MSARVELTKRDVELLQTLNSYGILSSQQIARWFFFNVQKTTVLRRLRLLEKGNYVRKRGTLPDSTAVYVIGINGLKALCENPKLTTYPINQLTHEIEIANVRRQLESLGSVKAWLTERELRSEVVKNNPGTARKDIAVPDALVLLSAFFKDIESLKIEIELTPKSNERYKSRFEKMTNPYLRDNKIVWYFVPNLNFAKRILTLGKRHAGSDIAKLLYVSVIEDVMTTGVNAKIYGIDGTYIFKSVLKIPENAEQGSAHTDAQALSRQNEAA